VSSSSPAKGPAKGGTNLVVFGQRLTPDTTVTVGGAALLGLTYIAEFP
jgi:hypothetical protein